MVQICLNMGLESGKTFDGTLIAKETTAKPGLKHWSEFELYRHVDGRYVLYTVGRTVVYHVLDNSCGSNGRRTGVPVAGREVDSPRNLGVFAEPCPRCTPPVLEDLAGGVVVDCELNRFSCTVFDRPEEVGFVLRLPDEVVEKRRRLGQPFRQYSDPAERLLEAAKAADSVFAAALSAPQPL